MKLNKIKIPLLICCISLLLVLLLAYPEASWRAAGRGLSIWWDVLFPSLFPFFVISEVLLGYGIVHFFGTILDPLMKPIFRIPGSGGFVAAMGFASGYPVSAKLTSKLREQKLISRIEGERLVAFTTSSDPIFLIGAVSVGFFHNAELAGMLAFAHYGGSLILGFLMRFHGAKEQNTVSRTSISPFKRARSFSLTSAIKAMHNARLQDGRDTSELLKQAVTSSLHLMTVVGGLVVFFSVILEVLTDSGLMNVLYSTVRHLLSSVGLPSALSAPFIGGWFEVTLGAKAAAATTDGIPLSLKAAVAAFGLSWGGLSVHAQVASILNSSDLRYMPFMIARLVHAFISATLVLLFWNNIMGSSPASVFAWSSSFYELPSWNSLLPTFIFFIRTLSLLLILATFLHIIHSVRANSKEQNTK